ncbi:outer membrane transport energization protein TonB [Trichlorobacter thiogenes]|uniref:Outer membrane transport energization protein TonB n=1 Tax=Trichlorobacter thiogenes TaxID=115783 RepID=A0A1T4K4S1_9BACT|nr:energy transducer TonB [Trichlorobacter thiogenes]SJZ37431.1 outer membrane transport energization protein TonB [Trichlorobacter thiogenes]
MIKWTGLSLALHLSAVGLLIAAGPHLQQPKPVMIDLTLAPSLRPGMVTAAPKAAPAAGAGLPKPAPPPKKAAPVPMPQQKPLPAPAPQQSSAVAQERTAAPQSAAAPQSRQPAAAQTGAHGGTSPSTGESAGKKTVAASSPPSGGGGAVTEAKAQQRYINAHFTYIRDLIIQHLAYPQLARRRGWSGRVVLAFVVAEDGSVRSIHVKESSGHTLLDNSAVETVKSVAPFPKPPVAAEITMPVVFRLY